jgi:hypothetical protein
MHTEETNDRAYFAAHKARKEYVRAPWPNEFDEMHIPAEARVRVYWINQRALVKALELPNGERLATVLEVECAAERTGKAA